jgi:hypothetical protein
MALSDRIAQSRSDYFTREAPTRIDIRPQSAASGGESSFFGEDGLTFRDVLDAVNPLNHIPVISDMLASATGHTASTASRLVGGTLMGGPIGFVASLASVIFESSTGASPAQAVYAALTDEPPASTQLAEASPEAADTPMELASLAPAGVSERTPPSVTPTTSAPLSTSDKAVLDLYGSSASAHDSYRKAQMLPYLRDVNRSQVL